MNRVLSIKRRICALCSALPLLAGCGDQVGEQYVGEVLLELRGTVRLEQSTEQSSVPALAFQSSDLLFPGELSIVTGTVEGIFPSDFVATFTAPPPEGVLANGVALGSLGFLPSGVSRLYAYPFVDTDFLDRCAELASTGSCEYTEVACQSGGACLERDFSCEAAPCELVTTTGDPAIASMDLRSAPPVELTVCTTSECRAIRDVCTGTGDCYREEYVCPGTASGIQSVPGLASPQCTETAVRGEVDNPELFRPLPAAEQLLVVYLQEGAEFPEKLRHRLHNPEQLRPGYNLLESTVEYNAEALRGYTCLRDWPYPTLREYNEANGTSFTVLDETLPSDLEQALEQRALEQLARCEQEAPPILQVVPEPSRARLEIRLGAAPSL